VVRRAHGGKLYISSTNRALQYTADDFFHPAFLYESFWNLAVFATLIGIRRAAPSPPGTVFFLYVALYSVGRFLIEAIRIDSFWLGPFRVAQLASVVGVTLATGDLLVTRPRDPAV
jgi:phosphatidylglycerol:prolipoprotein diacylglycerol transferase